MATIKAFRGYRPRRGLESEIASPPYDVLSSAEARTLVAAKPHSFLHVGKSEIDLDEGLDPHDEAVYRKARENLDSLIAKGLLVRDEKASLYVYRQTMAGRSQTGLLSLVSVDEYRRGLIKKHELTRIDKEEDRTRHILATASHSGPAFLIYRAQAAIAKELAMATAAAPDCDFVAEDGIRHSLWRLDQEATVARLEGLFAEEVPTLYIADGHHRSAAAMRAQERLGAGAASGHGYFLAVSFPDDELRIMDYNRVVADLNGHSEQGFLDILKKDFECRPLAAGESPMPSQAKSWGMYLGGKWYRLSLRPGRFEARDPIASLDVQILQTLILDPLLGVSDPRSDKRIDFVGGIRGHAELERRCAQGAAIAFQCYPTTLDELMRVADADKIMPPKSTWFEPKLRDGMVIDRIEG